MVSVSVDSVDVMPRTPAVTVPKRIALRQREQRTGLKRVGTRLRHQQDTEESDAKRRPACWPHRFPEQMIDASVANSGAEKLIAVALANGIMLKAMSRNVCEVAWEMLRAMWLRSLLVRNTARPVRGRITAAQTMSETRFRPNRISPGG